MGAKDKEIMANSGVVYKTVILLIKIFPPQKTASKKS